MAALIPADAPNYIGNLTFTIVSELTVSPTPDGFGEPDPGTIYSGSATISLTRGSLQPEIRGVCNPDEAARNAVMAAKYNDGSSAATFALSASCDSCGMCHPDVAIVPAKNTVDDMTGWYECGTTRIQDKVDEGALSHGPIFVTRYIAIERIQIATDIDRLGMGSHKFWNGPWIERVTGGDPDPSDTQHAGDMIAAAPVATVLVAGTAGTAPDFADKRNAEVWLHYTGGDFYAGTDSWEWTVTPPDTGVPETYRFVIGDAVGIKPTGDIFTRTTDDPPLDPPAPVTLPYPGDFLCQIFKQNSDTLAWAAVGFEDFIITPAFSHAGNIWPTTGIHGNGIRIGFVGRFGFQHQETPTLVSQPSDPSDEWYNRTVGIWTGPAGGNVPPGAIIVTFRSGYKTSEYNSAHVPTITDDPAQLQITEEGSFIAYATLDDPCKHFTGSGDQSSTIVDYWHTPTSTYLATQVRTQALTVT